MSSIFAISHFSAVPMEEFMLLPLMGIYYVLAGIMGQSPLASTDAAMQTEAWSAIPATAKRVTA